MRNAKKMRGCFHDKMMNFCSEEYRIKVTKLKEHKNKEF